MLGCDWAGLVDAQWDSRSYSLPPGVKNWFLKYNISLTWHRLISLFCYYPPPLKEDVTLDFNVFECPFHKDILTVPSLVEIGQVFLKKKIFKSRQCIFLYVAIISPWKNAWPLIWTNLNSLYPKILCVMFGWNWPSGSKVVNIFSIFAIISP